MSMQIFYDTQGQLNQQSEVGSTQGSNSSKFLWLPLLPERMKKIKSKVRVLERSQHYPSVLRCSRGANAIIGDGILTKFKLIQALIVVLIVCKNKEDAFKIENTRVVTTFLPL